jgi:biopolymer transport protein ExbD
MAAATDTQGSRAPISGINMTPLVDVVLVLLVVLMVTAAEVARLSLPLDLPAASTGEASAGTLDIAIDAGGNLSLDGAPSSITSLRDRARAVGPGGRATLAADGATPHRSVVEVLDALRTEGVSRYAIVVRPVAR